MRRLLSTLLAAGLVAAIPASAAQTVTVRISGKGFSPSSVKLNAGDSVGWVNDDTQSHQVVADTGAFASPILKHGQSYLFTFAKGGKFTYHDAFKSSLRGDVTVKGPPPTLTFGASAPIVVAGTAVALTGTVSNGAGGESVAILSKPYGQAAFAQVATIQTGTGGGFSYSIVPTLYTTYEAQWKTATSAPIILQVKPKITFAPYAGGRFRTAATAGNHSFAGRYVYLQRRSALNQWVSIVKLTLGAASGRIFALPRFHGTATFRIYMPVNSAGIGLLDGASGTQRIHRRQK